MAGPTIAEAVAAYLDGAELARSTRRTYSLSLRRMARELGPERPLGEVRDAEAVAWFQTAHSASMPASWNRERLTVRSAARWWREQGWTAPSFQALRHRRFMAIQLDAIAAAVHVCERMGHGSLAVTGIVSAPGSARWTWQRRVT